VYKKVQELIKQEMETDNKEKYVLTDKVRDEIHRDLKRTHTSERMRTEEGQEEMRRVL